MVNARKVVLSFIESDNFFYDRISTGTMPKEKALGILQQYGYPPGSQQLANLFKYIMPFIKPGRFQKEAGIVQDILRKVKVAPAVLMAIISLMQTLPAQELSEVFNIQSSNVIEKVKKTPQWIVNLMGEKGFLKILHTQYKKMVTPEVIRVLNEKDPSGQWWAGMLANEALRQIGQDNKLNQMYSDFIVANNLDKDTMKDAITYSVNNYLNTDQVKRDIQLAMVTSPAQGQSNVPGPNT